MAQIFPTDFEEKLTMAQNDYILFSDSEDGNKIKKAQYKNLKGEKGDTWATWPQWPQWEQWIQGIQGIQWPQGEQWEKWDTGATWATGATWPQWPTWPTGARINSASFSGDDIVFWETDGSSVTLTGAKTTLTWPQWEQGIQWETWATWATGNGISSITSSKSWKITTVTITETNGNSDSFTVEDGADGQWSWDVIWPNSSTDGDIVLFDGTTWKLIKDSGVWLASKLDASALSDTNYWWAWNGDTTHTPTKNAIYTKLHTMDVEIWNKAADNNVVKLSWNQSVGWTKTFTSEIVLPSKTTAATNDWTKPATEAQVKLVADDVATINGMISSNASSSNKLMDKNYIDDSINSVTAYYITKNAQGDQWATYSELSNASTFYSWWVARTPTRNDYTIVLADENYSNATTRYIYNSGWEYQYTVNETAMSQAQLDALNSWITAAKVTTYDGYASTISWKQDALTLPSTPTQWNLVVRWANNKTIADGWAVPTNKAAASWWADVSLVTTGDKYNWDNKQSALTTQTAYTTQWTSTKVPTITTNTLWQVTAITETSIDFPVTSVWGSTGAVWLKTVNNNSIVWTWNISVWTLTAETVVSGDSWTTYTIKKSSSAPTSATNTTITFVV